MGKKLLVKIYIAVSLVAIVGFVVYIVREHIKKNTDASENDPELQKLKKDAVEILDFSRDFLQQYAVDTVEEADLPPNQTGNPAVTLKQAGLVVSELCKNASAGLKRSSKIIKENAKNAQEQKQQRESTQENEKYGSKPSDADSGNSAQAEQTAPLTGLADRLKIPDAQKAAEIAEESFVQIGSSFLKHLSGKKSGQKLLKLVEKVGESVPDIQNFITRETLSILNRIPAGPKNTPSSEEKAENQTSESQ